jgi:hypothetical protein
VLCVVCFHCKDYDYNACSLCSPVLCCTYRALLAKIGRVWILLWHVLPEVMVLMRLKISMRGLVLLKWYANFDIQQASFQ